MRKFLFAALIFILIFAGVAAPAYAAEPQSFYMEKHCIGNQTCVVTTADPPLEFLVSATLKYTDHAMFTNPASVTHEAATVLITTTEGDSTVGHVSWVFVNGEFVGTVTILPGTGAFEGFHASAKIDVISWATYDFSFTGTYFFTP